jgi:hypothetical protein
MLYRKAYKAGMTAEDQEFLRRLRRGGFAVAIFSPVDVGNPLNRKPVEDQMVKAGRQALKQIEVRYER